ncbi:uncharacterized protein [Amphiura filiformis]|uniref:uncharacterized protein n=1 Tax=Amphiura filiformis TaxID=82378 RepID=UPI003B220D79
MDTSNNPVFGKVSTVGNIVQFTCGLQGRYISVHVSNVNDNHLTICELKAYDGDCPVTNITNIRLQDSPRETPNTGRLQVFSNNQWHDVCSDGDDELGNQDWRIKEAIVACRQLGYPGTAMITKGQFANQTAGPVIANMYCDGDEETLDDCRCTEGKESCGHGNHVNIICTAPGYQGCFQNVSPEDGMSHDQMTVGKCLQFCRNITNPVMEFAGLKSRTICLCGDENATYEGQVSDSECNLPCGGNDYEICGSEEWVSVYNLSLGLCEEPRIPFGRPLESDYSFGKWVTFECDTNHELLGSAKLQCVLGNTPNDCKWNEDFPSCQVIPPATTKETPPSTTKETRTTSPSGKTPQPQKGLSTGTIIGAAVGSLVLILIMIFLVVFLLKLRKKRADNQSKPTPSTTTNQFNRSYDLTVSGVTSNQPSNDTIKQPVYANSNQENQSAGAIYHDFPESSTDDDPGAIYYSPVGPTATGNNNVSVIYAKPQKKRTNVDTAEDGSLYYATSDTKESVGWEENAAYDSFAGDDGNVERERNTYDNKNGGDDAEGWEDNMLYGVGDRQGENTTEWMDNDIYAGSDDE